MLMVEPESNNKPLTCVIQFGLVGSTTRTYGASNPIRITFHVMVVGLSGIPFSFSSLATASPKGIDWARRKREKGKDQPLTWMNP